MNNKRIVILLCLVAYYLIVAGIFFARWTSEPPADNPYNSFRPCFMPDPVGVWHDQTRKIYWGCFVLAIAPPPIIWARRGFLSGERGSLNWFKGLDRILIVLGVGWSICIPGLIIYYAFVEDFGRVDWLQALTVYIGGFVLLIGIRFLCRAFSRAVNGFK